jgi:hypothetical protein
LETFVKSKVTMIVNAPLKLGKTIGLVLYWFVDGANANIIANRFNLGAFTMRKYVDIVINALVSKDKLFSRYIFIFHGISLFKIMDGIFLHVAYPMFMVLLMRHIFHFPKS